MTPTEINIALAEFEGWTVKSMCANRFGLYNPSGSLVMDICFDPKIEGPSLQLVSHYIPNYHSDLNAVARVETLLKSKEDSESRYQWTYYLTNIDKCSPAPQRCEALLKTIGKWKE